MAEAIEGAHVFLSNLKVEDVHVFADVVGSGGLRDHHEATLKAPTEKDLRRALPILRTDRADSAVVQLHPVEALLTRPDRVAVPMVAVPQLRRHEHVLTWDAASADGDSDISFIAVQFRGIDKSVSTVEGVSDRFLRRGPRRDLPYSEAHDRHPHAVVHGNPCGKTQIHALATARNGLKLDLHRDAEQEPRERSWGPNRNAIPGPVCPTLPCPPAPG